MSNKENLKKEENTRFIYLARQAEDSDTNKRLKIKPH